MPCQDTEARNYLEDHRTQSLINDQKDLEKQVKNLQKEVNKSKSKVEKELENKVQQLESDNIRFAEKLNKTTELLCNATFKMFKSDKELYEKYRNESIWNNLHIERPSNLLEEGTKLHDWFLQHTEDDASRMKEELDKIKNNKNKTLQSLIKWYNGLDDKEKWVFETHKNFKGIKLS